MVRIHRATVSFFFLAAGLAAFVAAPVLAQERPAPQGAGSHEHATSRPSGGGSSSSSPSGGSTSSSSGSGGSSVGSGSSGGGYGHAVPRGEGRRGGGSGASSRTSPRTGNPKSVIVPAGPDSEPGTRREPVPSYARPRAGRPVTGTAVPRDETNVPDLGWRRDPYWAYGYWQYSHWTPFYYGPWGGYMYYDPYWWDYYYGYGYRPYYGGYGYGGGYYNESDVDNGALKLKVRPRDAQVYVDGYFSGVVDDYDGVFQRLRLRSGGHRIELRAEGMQPTIFDVLIVPGETVTYRGELKPKS